MELALAIMMVLGIFVAIPAVIGFAIAGAYIWSDRRARKAERAKAREETVKAAEKIISEAELEQPAETAAHQKTRETAKVA